MPPGLASPVCHSTLMQFSLHNEIHILHPSSSLDQQFMRQTFYRGTNTKFPFYFGEMFLWWVATSCSNRVKNK